MLTKDEFIEFILTGPKQGSATKAEAPAESSLPEGYEGFEAAAARPPPAQQGSSFARRLLEASGFGYPEMVDRDNVIRSADAVARHLPARVYFWPKSASRPYQTILFETEFSHKQLLVIPTFKSRTTNHLDMVEDALARLVSEALEGFQRGGEGVTADVRKGPEKETLCVVSILDEREGEPVRLVCFGTRNGSTDGLETFNISEQTRLWDRQLAREHLGLVYARQFKKLEGQDWQEAFTTTEERKQAEKLLEVCTRRSPKEHDIQESVLDLLDLIAKGFGLRKKPKTERRLQAFALPADHDIGIDSEEREGSFGGNNPFGGVTLRDERSRLLGYIVYPLRTRADAARLRKHLEANNRFHNVLVVYPDEDQTCLELWQGREQLTGKLRRGQGYKDAADVVNLLSRFFVVSKAKVKNPTELAQELAYRARYLRRLAVKQLEAEQDKGSLRNLYNAFKEALVHDQTEDEFADAFAQTITYGLLTARWTGNDQLVADGERLTRQTALKHLPAASHFLNDLFKSALSVKLDEQHGRLLWLVDDLADLLDRVDVTYVFGVGDKGSDSATDPVIHFYEPFLAAYDKELKNKRGVFFTPRPVVSYIVRSVQELLQKEFGLEDGLASTDTWGDLAKRIVGLKMPEGVKATDPFVCILDPATGTGTFLFECIEVIERTMKERWCKELKKTDWKDPAVVERWSEYVPKHLLPRLYGYELMMASYAIAHLKLSFKLRETGFRLTVHHPFRVFLTNSLEPPAVSANPRVAHLFATLATEAQEVNEVKRTRRFTVVLGNPPYAGHSVNNQVEWIVDKVHDYKRGLPDLQKPGQAKWLQDDYVKFLRLAEHIIQTSGVGVVGMITNHSFMDNPTFRGLRKSFLKSYSRMCFLDLHGNTKSREVGPDKKQEENVFDIQQGVAISLLSRRPQAQSVVHADLWGGRQAKYARLSEAPREAIQFAAIDPNPEHYLFVPQNQELRGEYDGFVPIHLAMSQNGDPAPGIVTTHDEFAISFSAEEMKQKVEALVATRNEAEAREMFQLCTQNQWNYVNAKRALHGGGWKKELKKILYRPFDVRWTVFNSHVAVHRRERVMRHMVAGDNLGLITTRAVEIGRGFEHVFCARGLIQHHTVSIKEVNYLLPLYLHPDPGGLSFSKNQGKILNYSPGFLRQLADGIGANETAGGLPEGVGAEDVFFYVYAVLHSPTYRARYAEFLRTDFPRIPLPLRADLLGGLAALGSELVGLHLLESPKVERALTTYLGTARPEVEKASFSERTVWVDRKKTCGFKGVDEAVWNFHIGGYQVLDKWMKDRKGSRLSKDEVGHYQKIIVALSETIRVMKAVDETIERHGGWPRAFVNSGGRK